MIYRLIDDCSSIWRVERRHCTKRGMRVKRISITKKKTLGLPFRSLEIRLWRQLMSKSTECKEIDW